MQENKLKDDYYASLRTNSMNSDLNSPSNKNAREMFHVEDQQNETQKNFNKFESLDQDRKLNMPFLDMKSINHNQSFYSTIFTSFLVRCIITGLVTGLILFIMEYTVELLQDLKQEFTNSQLEQNEQFAAVVFFCCFSVILGLVGTLLTVQIQPAASGGGIPEIKAQLNGTNITNLFTPSTLLIKILGTICALASGLYIGIEAPAIHIGGCVGALLAHLPSAESYFAPDDSEDKDKQWQLRFRDDNKKRDLISCGLAAGVSAGFMSPIGGICFVLEEAQTFWSLKMTIATFFTSMSAGIVYFNLMASKEQAVGYQLSKLGNFNNNTVKLSAHLHYIIIFGLLVGLLGSFFNFVNKSIMKFRITHGTSKIYKIAEVMAVVLITALIKIMVPLYIRDCRVATPSFNCTTEDINDLLNQKILSAESQLEQNCIHKNYQQQFQCPDRLQSPIASIFQAHNQPVIKSFFQNPGMVGIVQLLLFNLLLFGLMLVTHGIAIPMGFFVPCILLGAAFGRLYGETLLQFVDPSLGIDPGVFALVGAGTMITGITRLTFTTLVIIFEITNESQMNIPIMIAVICAKFTGDYFNNGIQDIIIFLKKIPIVEEHVSFNLWKMEAMDVMSRKVVALRKVEKAAHLVQVLESCQHNGFPVIGNNKGHFLGTITRDELHVLLNKLKPNPHLNQQQNGNQELSDHQNLLEMSGNHNSFRMSTKDLRKAITDSTIEQPVLHIYDFAKKMDNSNRKLECQVQEMEMDNFQDLGTQLNKSAISVLDTCPLGRVQELFRCLGLRHLVVTNTDQEVIGIITRKDLMNDQKSFYDTTESGNLDEEDKVYVLV